ncbi:MAG: hypothetical protein HND48_05980 [Chloroflexi bacterium]|nr:hypothetical protein [Chloroflexota bacterium]
MSTASMSIRPAKPRSYSKWFVNALTIVLCILWAIPILWAIVVSLRPRSDALGRGRHLVRPVPDDRKLSDRQRACPRFSRASRTVG